MAVEYLGYDTAFSTSVNEVTDAMTVPAGTDCVVVIFGGYFDDVGWTLTTGTFGGVDLIPVNGTTGTGASPPFTANLSYEQCAIWVATSTEWSTSENLVYDVAGTNWYEGINKICLFFSGVDQSNPIIDSDFALAGANISGLTIDTGSMTAIGCAGYSGNISLDTTGQTEVANFNNGAAYLAGAYGEELTTATEVASSSGYDTGCMVAATLRAASVTYQSIIATVPRTKFPPQRVERFDRSNPYGKHCFFAFVPGWSHWEVDGSTQQMSVESQQPHLFRHYDSGGSEAIDTVTVNYGANVGVARAARFEDASGETRRIIHETQGSDLGLCPPQGPGGEVTIVGIARPSGDGRPGSSTYDPRIFSQDTGTSEADHDLMIGIATAGQEPRCRVRINDSTFTIVPGSGSNLQQDTLAIWGGGAYYRTSGGGGYDGFLSYLAENGTWWSDGFGTAQPVGYTPRTGSAGMDMAMGATAEALTNDNGFAGDIIAVFAFDTAIRERWQYEELLRNPWQVFEPEYIPIYWGGVAGPIEGSLTFGLDLDLAAAGIVPSVNTTVWPRLSSMKYKHLLVR